MSDADLSGEQRAFRDAARAAARRIAVPDADPDAQLRELGRLGFLGIPFPSTLGGQDGDLLAFVVCVEAFAEVDRDLADALADAVCLGILPIAALATREQARRLLPPLLAGAATAAWCREAGRLSRTGAAWILDAPPSPLEGRLPARLSIRPVEGPDGPALVVLPVPRPGDLAPAANSEPVAGEAVLGPPGRVPAAVAEARAVFAIVRDAAVAAGDGPHRTLARSRPRVVAIDP